MNNLLDISNIFTDKSILHFGLFISIMIAFPLVAALILKVDQKRIISQFIMYIVMYIILVMPPLYIAIFFSAISIFMLKEIFSCIQFYNKDINLKVLKIISYTILPFIPFIYIAHSSFLLIVSIGYCLLCAAHFVTSKSITNAIIGIFGFKIALISILCLGLFVLLRTYPDGQKFTLYIFFLTNTCDTGALIFGKMLGKRKLIPSISPNKTIAGSMGALGTGIVLSCLFIYFLQIRASLMQAVLIGLLVGVYSQVGDLLASVFKRHTGIKDYGDLIPGHGGVLDRFDSLLITLPLFFMLLSIFQIN